MIAMHDFILRGSYFFDKYIYFKIQIVISNNNNVFKNHS